MLAAWCRRRSAPLVAGALAVLAALAFFALWNRLGGQRGDGAWYVPGDLRGTVLAAGDYFGGHLGAVYGPKTGLVTLPGILLLLAPGLGLAVLLHPGLAQAPTVFSAGGPGWLPIELFSMLAVPAFTVAADALAERLGVPARRRALLAAAQAAAACCVVAWWGHPEDVAALALLLGALSALLDGRPSRAAWLTGAAIAVQPFTLVAVGLMVGRLRPGQGPRFLARAAVPPLALLGPVLVGGWRATLHALSQQPNFPSVDHATSRSTWSLVAPGIGHQVLAAGPLRLAAVLLAVEGGLWYARRHPLTPAGLVFGVGLCLALRVVLEPVMVAYYVWPALALAMVGAARSTRAAPLWACATLALFALGFGTASWDSNWSWWLIELLCTLGAAGLAIPGTSSPGQVRSVGPAAWPPVLWDPSPGRGGHDARVGTRAVRSGALV